MRQLLNRFARWLQQKTMPPALMGHQWTGTSYVDSYKRTRQPTSNELAAELKGTAWACASINAAVCASLQPKLYTRTLIGQPPPKCKTAPISNHLHKHFIDKQALANTTIIEQVTEHPLLTLLKNVNPIHNSFDLWELTQLYLEVHGRSYWLIVDDDTLGIPAEIWVLPTQNVTPRRRPDSPNPIDYYEYKTGKQRAEFQPDEIIFHRIPDPRDPYIGGLSPLRACYEQVSLMSEFAATKAAIYENRGLPSAIVSPDEVIGEEERDRLEAQWNQKFRRGGTGRVVIAESRMRMQILQQSLGDLAALSDMKATKEDIANAFHIPLPFLSSDTNLANMQAADILHRRLAITPRIRRRDEKLNEQLIPRYDQSGRLFLATDAPDQTEQQAIIQQENVDIQLGIRTIDEVRQQRGLRPLSS